jgi:hypothetical protein
LREAVEARRQTLDRRRRRATRLVPRLAVAGAMAAVLIAVLA